jgi:hypothetical protein
VVGGHLRASSASEGILARGATVERGSAIIGAADDAAAPSSLVPERAVMLTSVSGHGYTPVLCVTTKVTRVPQPLSRRLRRDALGECYGFCDSGKPQHDRIIRC